MHLWVEQKDQSQTTNSAIDCCLVKFGKLPGLRLNKKDILVIEPWNKPTNSIVEPNTVTTALHLLSMLFFLTF